MSESRRLPFFSVVMPTHDRPERLEACLRALADLDYPADRYEVVVVDDGGRAPLEPLVAPFEERLALRFLRQENAGPAAARNRGAEAAAGDVLAFIDDDCIPDPVWLERFANRITPERVLGGRTVNVLSNNPYAEASQLLIDYLLEAFGPPDHPPLFPSNNLAVPADVFRDSGGFDEGFDRAGGEDRELCDRLARRGLEFELVPDAIVNHAHDLGFKSFLGQHWRYGRGAHRFHALRANATGGIPRPEGLRFYLDLLVYPIRHEARRRFATAWLLALSQVANATGFAASWITSRRHDRNGEGSA